MRSAPARFNRMHPLSWIPPATPRLLDVGCNVGELLASCAERMPSTQLAGVDVNAAAVATARARVPGADIRLVTGSSLPFPDASFDCVTSIEVLEHVPARDRRAGLAEMGRVLAPGGRLVLRCPHAGLFAWLDPANFRHRFPKLYRAVLRRGLRDGGYPGGTGDIVWHHHFTERELQALMPAELSVEAVRFGGLFVFPLSDCLRAPFYRTRRHHHPVVRALAWLADRDYGVDYGRASFGILIAARKGHPASHLGNAPATNFTRSA